MKTYNIIKGIASLALSFCLAGTANAQSWGLEETQLTTAGGRDTLRIQLTENDFTFTSFQTDVTLPEGLMITDSPFLGTGMANGHTISWEAQTGNTYRCVAYSGNNNDMKATNGTLLCIPVQLTTSFTSGNVTVTKGLLANKKSETKEVPNKDISVRATKQIKVELTNPVQKVTEDLVVASLLVTPEELEDQLTIAYYTDEACTTSAKDEDRTTEGTLYVKVTFDGNAEYEPFSQVFQLTLTGKIDIAKENIIAPTASSLANGQKLSLSTLSGGSATDKGQFIPGRFIWENGEQTVSSTNNTFNVTFLPDLDNYNPATISVTIEVKETYIIVANASEGGSVKVTGERSDNTYVEGQSLTLEATPNEDYQFDGWTKNGTSDGEELERTVTAREDATYFATFTPINRTITWSTEGEGSLKVINNGTEVSNGSSVQQGTTLQIIAEPSNNGELTSLTVNGTALQGNQLKVTDDLTITAEFERKENPYTVTVETAENGRVVVYTANGSQVPSGSSVPANTQIRVIALPNAGYELDDLSCTGATQVNQANNENSHVYVVTGNATITPSFKEREFTITKQAVNSDNIGDPAGSIEVAPEKAQYGETVTFTVTGDPLYVLVNGKKVSFNGNQGTATVTGDMTITAVFNRLVDIEENYIMFPHQEYYYSGESRTFVPFASQTYAGFSFDVTYKRTHNGLGNPVEGEKEIAQVKDAGTYTVLLHRDADGLYKEFNAVYEERLVIKQSTIAVTEAPTSANGTPTTRPEGEEVEINSTGESPTIYTILPRKETKTENNYQGTTYYYFPEDAAKATLNVNSVLRSATEQTSYVLVTNGGLEYSLTDGKADIPIRAKVLLEAVPSDDKRFVRWSDDNEKRVRDYTITESNNNIYPIFEDKATPSISLKSTTSVYDGTNHTVELSGEPDVINTCKVTFYSDEACTQSTTLKNAGTYYIKIERDQDDMYQKVVDTSLKYTITQDTPVIDKEPEATDIMAGETLSMSELMGGSAGIVPGTFAWSKPDIPVTASGEYEVTFTPADPNYEATTLKVYVNAVGSDGEVTEPDDSGDSDDSSDPSDPDRPSRPTDIEAIEAETVITAEHQTIQIRPAQPMTVSVVNMSGALLYHGDIADITSIPVGTSGVYIVKMNAGETEIVKKINVR